MDKIGKIYTVLESSEKAIPQSLEFVIKSFESPSTNHLLIGVMYTLMLECGYTLVSPDPTNGIERNPQDTVMPTSDMISDQSLTSTFSYGQILSQTNLLSTNYEEVCDICKLTFNLIGSPDHVFTLMVIYRRGLTVVDLVVNINDEVDDCYSVAFSPSSFVQESNDDENIATKFHDLKTFSILFKDNIALKGRSHVLNSLQIANNSLEGLPEEIFLKIMRYLEIDDILNVAITSSKFFSGVRQRSLWIFLLKRDFSLTLDCKDVEQLIFKYREEKIKRRNNSRDGVVDIDDFDGVFHDVDNPINGSRNDFNGEIYYLPRYSCK